LCKLNIRVSVPLEVSPMMAGKNLGVSGCLGSISI